MKYIHADAQFADLLRIVGADQRPSSAPSLVEKDYWVTHTLWCVQRLGLECWFKGGTSLSKGFGLIQRFSEDLDLKLGPGSAADVPGVANWKSESKKHVAARQSFFEAVAGELTVPGAKVELHGVDERWRSAELRIVYPSALGEQIPEPLRPFVVIEAGSARVVPHVERDLSSFVHAGLASRGMLDEFEDTQPRAVRCVHPVVTLIEKLDAIVRRFGDVKRDAAAFVRHYEDAARILGALDSLPAVEGGVDALVTKMLAASEIRGLPSPSADSINPKDTDRWREIRRAYDATAVMFFGERVGLDEACASVRRWVADGQRA